MAGAETAGDCEVCQAGHHSADHRAHSCSPCVGGRYQNQAGQSSCKKCAAGRQNALAAQTTSTACKDCAAGKYQPVEDRTFCVPCGHGFFYNGTGAANCTKCPKGMYGNTAEAKTLTSGCQFCAKGWYQDTEASTGCKACQPTTYSSVQGAESVSTCLNCPWGEYTVLPAQEVCVKCEAGKHGNSSAGVQGHPGHCIHCPRGQYQEVDGSTSCQACAPDTYVAMPGTNVNCSNCSQLDVDTNRVYWTNGQSGQTQCTQKPLNCEMNKWSSWGTCTLSCKAGTAVVGRQSRSRTAKSHGTPGTASCQVADCAEGWGVGALLCSASINFPEEGRNCNEHQCPVNCEVTGWSSWSQCTKFCGKGQTTRQRAVRIPAAYGGTCDEHTSETTDCNDISCSPKDLPHCHNQHIHCSVVTKTRVGSSWGPDHGVQCGLRYGDCHHCDNPLECGMQGEHKTIVVSHDRKYASLGGVDAFHCFYAHPTHPNNASFPALSANQCFCTCSMHPPCEGIQGKALANTPILGNRWHGILTRHECCNMCTNHPQCGAFTYLDHTQLCLLFEGAPSFVDAVVPSTTWSGCQSGDQCNGTSTSTSNGTSVIAAATAAAAAAAR